MNMIAPGRATPPCPHFGPCGGCQLQHLTYSAQLADKTAQLRRALDATNLELPELQLHPSPPLFYRNRIRLTLAEASGELRAGYIRTPDPSYESAPTFLPITECPIAAPILWRATIALLAELNQRSDIWRERTPFMLDQLELFATPEDAPDEAQLQISLYVRTSAKSLPAKFTGELAALCESVRARIPALAGAGMYLLPTRPLSRRVEQPRPGPTWGTPGLNYTVVSLESRTSNPEPGLTYWVPRGAFFQINRFLLPELVSVVAAGRSGQLAWDLYAGVGLFTRALAPHFARITAVEIAEPAFTALASARLSSRHAVKSATIDFLQTAVLQRDRPDLIVLDPPRTGAGREVCGLLARIATPTLIYVSCSPENLAADLVTLGVAGYTVAELHLLDLFPQTTHIETVAVLTR
jgi:23S rRNA (uracil1939-C5)-methyltransferase